MKTAITSNLISLNQLKATVKSLFNKIVSNVSKMTPPTLKNYMIKLQILIRLIYNYDYDLMRFLKWSSVNKNINSQTKLRALITMDYHRLEKGLALKMPKVGFGKDVIARLLYNIPQYVEKYDWDETALITLNTLLAYHNFNSQHGLVDQDLYKKIISWKSSVPEKFISFNQGGTTKVTKSYIIESSNIDLLKFLESRYSVRNFTDENINIELLKKAIFMAQKTPSVCNRQSSKVYLFTSEDDKRKVLSYQNGNRGFGEQASNVLIVVSDLENFTSTGERNQCWIDGGMYAMSLVYALHSLGLGTCCLNWSVGKGTDQALKKATGIKDSESIIMMIAVGHLPDELSVAQSPRKEVEEVLIIK
jgi:nitroreductase